MRKIIFIVLIAIIAGQAASLSMFIPKLNSASRGADVIDSTGSVRGDPSNIIDIDYRSIWYPEKKDRIELAIDLPGVARVKSSRIELGEGPERRISVYALYYRNSSDQEWRRLETFRTNITGEENSVVEPQVFEEPVEAEQFRLVIEEYRSSENCSECGVPVQEFTLRGYYVEEIGPGIERLKPSRRKVVAEPGEELEFRARAYRREEDFESVAWQRREEREQNSLQPWPTHLGKDWNTIREKSVESNSTVSTLKRSFEEEGDYRIALKAFSGPYLSSRIRWKIRVRDFEDEQPPNLTVVGENATVGGKPVVEISVNDSSGIMDAWLVYSAPTPFHELEAEEEFKSLNRESYVASLEDAGKLDGTVEVERNGSKFVFPASVASVRKINYTVYARDGAGNLASTQGEILVKPRIDTVNNTVGVTYRYGDSYIGENITELTLTKFVVEEGFGQAVETGTEKAMTAALRKAGVSAGSKAAAFGQFMGLTFSVLQYSELGNPASSADLRIITDSGMKESVKLEGKETIDLIFTLDYGTDIGDVYLEVADRSGRVIHREKVVDYSKGPGGDVFYLKKPPELPENPKGDYKARLVLQGNNLDTVRIEAGGNGLIEKAKEVFMGFM